MTSSSRLILLALLCLGLLLPAPAWGDDPVEEPPAAGPDEPIDPNEPPPVVPSAPVDPDDPPPIIPDEMDEPEDQPEDEPEPEPDVPMRTVTISEVTAPQGMLHLPAGSALIGTTFQRLGELVKGRPQSIAKDFIFEAPAHQVEMPGFFLDRYEVTHAQYLAFMQDTAQAVYDTSTGSLANLEEVAGYLLLLAKDEWNADDVAWRQLYQANRELLHAAMPSVVVKVGDAIDERATENAFRRAPLARGVELAFYTRKPPETWPDLQPPPTLLDHPVTSVSYDDAEAFAEWAGKHIPTEQEWEYAARGPESFFWPWGNKWFPDASHANWGGKIIDESTFTPITVPVDSMPEGMSWCGIHHLLGNVAEWTSSWFDRYPGNEREHPYMGRYVKVIRGASLVDADGLALRPAARNFVGAGPKAPPRPGNRFDYVGFRCAWYGEPGRDPLGPVLRRAARGRRVTDETVDLTRWAGAAAVNFAEGEVENHVYVQGRAHSIVVIPLRQLIKGGPKAPRVATRKALMKLTEASEDPMPLAVLHTDVALKDVYVRAPKQPGASARPARGGRRRTKPEAPPTVKGDCAPGTYVLGIWYGRLCLCLPSLEFVCFLSKKAVKTSQVDLVKMKLEDMPPARIELTALADLADISLAVPLGGKEAANGASASAKKVSVVFVKQMLLETVEDGLSAAGEWRNREAGAPGEADGPPEDAPEDAPDADGPGG